jgi:SAM-dependent methyltransferase
VTATDFDPAQVALAESRLSDLRGRVILRVADARDLPFEDARFDAVFSFGVMHHIAGGWRRVVAEVARVLKPEGAFVHTDIYLADWVARRVRRLRPRFDQLEHGPLAEVLAENGFRIDHECWERHACGLLASGRTVARRRGPPPNAVVK